MWRKCWQSFNWMTLRLTKFTRNVQEMYCKGKIKWFSVTLMWFPQGHLHIPQSYTLGLYQCHQVQPLAPAEQALFVPVSWWVWLMRAGWACSVQSRCGANLPWLSQLTLSENQNQQREYDNNVLQGPCFSLCLLSCWWNTSEFMAKNGAQVL